MVPSAFRPGAVFCLPEGWGSRPAHRCLRSIWLAALEAVWSFAILAAGPAEGTAQITVAPYAIRVTSDVDSIRYVKKPRASSPCGIVRITWEDERFSGGCAGTLVRTYSFADPCDSIQTVQQYIGLQDHAKPVLHGLPETELLRLPALAVWPDLPVVTATDNSGEPVEVHVATVSTDYGLERTWTAEDACGNVAFFRQQIIRGP